MVNDRPEKFFIGVTVEEDFVECFFSRHTDESLELSRELAVVKRERRLTRYCLKLEDHRELDHVFAIAGSQTRKQTPTILAEVPTMLLPPPGDLQAASIDSLETGLTRLDIDVPAKDIVSSVREEKGAAHVKQIDYAAPSERNSPASTARPLSFNTSNTLVSIHPPDQDAPVLPFLLPEIFDLIVDHLHSGRNALKACCLVSKSWVPRARKHLFASVQFWVEGGIPIGSWMKLFPDPSSSPAYHTRSLTINGRRAVTAASTDACAWIHSFLHIVKFEVITTGWYDGQVSLVQFRALSRTLKSLSLYCTSIPLSEIFGLICSFPLLEDLALHHWGGDANEWATPSTSPKLTGSLQLYGENRFTAKGLLGLPDGLHFSKIITRFPVGGAKLVMGLVSACSDTLEFLCVDYSRSGAFPSASVIDRYLTAVYGPGTDTSGMPPPLDLSRATKLTEVKFRAGWYNIPWIIMTLQAAKPKSLRQITIHSDDLCIFTSGEQVIDLSKENVPEWQELDHLLVELWASQSILPKITCSDNLQTDAPRLLPGLTSRGIKPEYIRDDR